MRFHLVPLARLLPPAHLLPLLAVVALLAVPPPHGASGTGTVADAASAVLVVFCAVRVVRDRARPLSRTAAVVLGLPVLGICAAAVASHDPAASLPGVARYLQVFVLVPAAVVLLVRDRRDFAVVAWAMIGLALVQGTVGVVQYVTGTGASYQGEDVRAVGTFGATDVMGMATVVAYGIVAAAGIVLGSPGRRPRTWALVCGGLLLVPLVVSFSRGAWIATVLACALLLALCGVRRAVRVGLAAGALGVVLVAGLGIGSQLVQERAASITQVAAAPDRSVTDRYTMWAAAAGMWRAEPLTGVGLKGFPHYRDSHASLALSSGSDTAGAGQGFQRQPLLSPHNMYLLVLGEQGLLGLLTVAGSWLALLVCALRRLVDSRWDGLDCGLVAVGLLVWQLVDFVYADIGGPATVLTALALGLAAWWALAPPEPAVSSPPFGFRGGPPPAPCPVPRGATRPESAPGTGTGPVGAPATATARAGDGSPSAGTGAGAVPPGRDTARRATVRGGAPKQGVQAPAPTATTPGPVPRATAPTPGPAPTPAPVPRAGALRGTGGPHG